MLMSATWVTDCPSFSFRFVGARDLSYCADLSRKKKTFLNPNVKLQTMAVFSNNENRSMRSFTLVTQPLEVLASLCDRLH